MDVEAYICGTRAAAVQIILVRDDDVDQGKVARLEIYGYVPVCLALTLD